LPARRATRTRGDIIGDSGDGVTTRYRAKSNVTAAGSSYCSYRSFDLFSHAPYACHTRNVSMTSTGYGSTINGTPVLLRRGDIDNGMDGCGR